MLLRQDNSNSLGGYNLQPYTYKFPSKISMGKGYILEELGSLEGPILLQLELSSEADSNGVFNE